MPPATYLSIHDWRGAKEVFRRLRIDRPSLTHGRSATRALAKTFASSSFANFSDMRLCRLPDDARGVHKSRTG